MLHLYLLFFGIYLFNKDLVFTYFGLEHKEKNDPSPQGKSAKFNTQPNIQEGQRWHDSEVLNGTWNLD